MKRVLGLVLALVLACTGLAAWAEQTVAPDPYVIAYEALDILSAFMMCPSAASFDDLPGQELAAEAVAAYRLTGDIDGLTDEEIYAMIFASGEYAPLPETRDPNLLPVEIEIDSAIDCGDGTVKVSLTVNADYGDGYEFYCLVDIYLTPDAEAPCGSRICRVFFPE